MRTPHKLAAILFADIAGYTAMMADNESLALEKLSIFKEQLNKALLVNSGRLVQYFGDGGLCTFESSIQAMECAIFLQKALGRGTLVPVRIGIHTGDVIYKEGNVYGDAVNIASRIESIGQPGTILVSSQVRNQVKSAGTFEFASLGMFDFKNVDEAIEVYALSNQGFTVPSKSKIEGKIKYDKGIKRLYLNKKKNGLVVLAAAITLVLIYQLWAKDFFTTWSLRSTLQDIAEDGLVIFNFENKTGDSIYNFIQCRVNTIMVNSLKEHKIKVNNYSTLCHGSQFINLVKNQIGPSRKMEQLVGSKFGLDGNLFKNGDDLIISARIFNTITNEHLHATEDIHIKGGNIDQGIRDLTRDILNYWLIKDDPIFSDDLPNPGWYEKYNKAITFIEKDYPKVLDIISECKRIDSTQFRPDFLALEVYEVEGKRALRDSLISYLEGKRDQLSSEEINLLNFRKALATFKYRLAYELFMNEYHLDPKNPYINYSAMAYAVKFVNKPEDAIKIGSEIPYQYLDFNDCFYCMDRTTLLARAQIELGLYDEAYNMLTYATDRELGSKDLGNMTLRIRALVRKGDEVRLNALLEKSKFQEYSPVRDYKYFLYWTASEFHINKDTVLAKKYSQQYFDLIGPNPTPSYQLRKAVLLTALEEIEEAEAILLNDDIQESYGGSSSYIYLLGHISARLGKNERANKCIAQLDSMMNEENRGSYSYYKSLIASGYNNKDSSYTYLKEALIYGKRFTIWQLQNELLLTSIKDSIGFKEIINNI